MALFQISLLIGLLSRLVYAEPTVGISTISLQFRRIEFWLIQPKQPFEISISRIYIRKSQALYVSRSEEKLEASHTNVGHS